MEFMEFSGKIVSIVSQGIGIVGLCIIVTGCLRAFWNYLVAAFHHERKIARIRILLSSHMVLGLDFLVGKDIIDTLLLSHGEEWEKLGGLCVIILLRILLNHFLLKELDGMKES